MNPSSEEESQLLLPTIVNDKEGYDNNNSNSNVVNYNSNSNSNNGRRNDSVDDSSKQMKITSHNYESVEDFQELLGSTVMLRNAIDEKNSSKMKSSPLFEKKRRSSSLNMLFSVSEYKEEQKRLQSRVNGRTMFENGRQSSSSDSSSRDSEGYDDVNGSRVFTRMSMLYNSQIKNPTTLYLQKIKVNFFEDAKSLAEGTIPQSIVLAIIIGIVCGIACYLYYTVLFFFLDYLWTTLPEKYVVGVWPEHLHWLWIPLVSFSMVTLVGLTVIYMGEPGDLPYTISRVHAEAFIPMNHVTPMVFASLFSILAGGSLGPEAPLVAICGALGGFVSRRIFRQTSTNVVRKHTFMGMSGALAAFFGVPLGGSLFALEVCSRFGIEYFEHLIESIFCGEICLMVFRSLSGLPVKPIWDFTSVSNPRILESEPAHIILGAFIGLYGALLAYMFATFHWQVMAVFGKLNLLDNSRAVYRGWLGAVFIVLTMLLVPHTAFWGEDEIQVVATMGPAKDLPIIWPTTGLVGFEMDSPFKVFLVGCTKLIAVSFTVAGGLRGGTLLRYCYYCIITVCFSCNLLHSLSL
jgi:H+/Cl- antiporter ClcA